ncbi:MAG: NAD(+) synthase [Planctomycetota bacterium]|nr:NAD(+) synthase [Planctomycetota bacterium]
MPFRVAAAQINPTAGDFRGNIERIVQAAGEASRAGADIMVTCAMALTGYPLGGLVARREFRAAAASAMAALRDRLRSDGCRIPVVVGTVAAEGPCGGGGLLPVEPPGAEGDSIYPGGRAVLIRPEGGDPEVVARAGAPSAPVTAGCGRAVIAMGLECRPGDADAAILMFSTRFAVGRAAVRESALAGAAAGAGMPVIWVNQVGGNGGTIFDGRSAAFDASGRLAASARAFSEDMLIVEIGPGGACSGPMAPGLECEEEEIFEALVLGLRDYIGRTGLKGAVLGLSGGVDSALVACIAVSALGPGRVLGVALPGPYTSPESLRDARALAAALGIRILTLPITGMFDLVKELFQSAGEAPLGDITEQNLQARLRALLLMALANKYGLALLNTGNKSEGAMGYCTLYGDSCGAVAVIGDLLKEQVYRLARHFNARSGREVIPGYILTRPPSAELRPGQKDSDSLPEYPVLDRILNAYLEEGRSPWEIAASGIERDLVERVAREIDAAEYKRRQSPFAFRISLHGYGQASNFPLAGRFERG